MTKKDYIVIAKALRNAKEQIEFDYESYPRFQKELRVDGIGYAIKHLLTALQTDNERFDSEKFESAILD